MTSSPSTVPVARHPTAIGNFFDKAGMLLVLLLLFVGCALFVENFLTLRNLQGLALAVSMNWKLGRRFTGKSLARLMLAIGAYCALSL